MSVARYHCEQRHGHTCVAACAAMAQGRRDGLPVAQVRALELALIARLGRDAIFLDVVAAEIGPEAVVQADPDIAENLMYLRDDLESGQWWHIALMHPGPMRTLHANIVPRPRPQHGELGDFGLPHAVLLVDVAADGLVSLDPWLATDHQPVQFSWTFFPTAWTGRYLPVHIQP